MFYDPEVVASMRARGITARPRQLSAPAAPQPAGFVLARRAGPRATGGSVVTHVVDVRSNVTITGHAARPDDRPRLLTAAAIEPQSALDLAEECTRLRRDNQRLVAEIDRLRTEVDRLTGNTRPARENAVDLDDSARRFSLLELDL